MSNTNDSQTTVDGSVGGLGSLYLKGLAMGLADSVPGVSGGTVAVITGIYDQFIVAITRVDLQAARLFAAGSFAGFWQHIQGLFLLTVGLGMLSGILLSANTVLYLLQEWVEPLMAFFVGLVLISSWTLRVEFAPGKASNIALMVAGIVLTLLVGSLTPQEAVGASAWYLYFCGAIAICALLLPGISGAFLLLILGVYESVLRALLGLEVVTIAVFVAGCVTGILIFSRVIAYCLNNYKEKSYAFLTGMLIGSVEALWPWQMGTGTMIDRHGEEVVIASTNVSPLSYQALSAEDPHMMLSLLCFASAMALVITVHAFAARKTGGSHGDDS